jgi:cell volume regulation protein A
VLGNREVGGRAGVIIEGESGANDPVGIALLISFLAVGADLGPGAIGDVLATFGLQMVIGAAVGTAGGWLLLRAMRRPLPSEALYPLRTLAIAVGLYGVATVAHGSGFLAVFIAGIMVGDMSAPFKRDIVRFHSSLAGLAEIVAFVVLGLTVSLPEVVTTDAWWAGLLLAVLLAIVVRPLLVGPLLLVVWLTTGERLFVVWAGLKGAVPILLGTYILGAGGEVSRWVYEVIFVVVAFSVIVQGGLVPTVAKHCRVPMQEVPPRPWSVGLRLRTEPESARHYRVGVGSRADGRTVGELQRAEDVWISLIVRDGHPLRVRADTVLQAGDEVLLDAEPPTEPGSAFEPK